MQMLEDGHVDVEKLRERFLEKADGDWKPVADNAVTKCREELASKNTHI
jgi:hypothetical protein